MVARRAPIVAELVEEIDASALAEAIAFNEMAGRLYVRGVLPWSDGGRPENRPWDSRDDSHGYAWVQERFGCGGERDFQHALTIVGDGRRYNPVTDMLEALPAWDGGGRVGYLMQSFLGADEGDYVSEVERLFMRAAITRAYRPGCKFDYMPVLVGPQGAGKSTFLRMLAMDDALFTDSVSGIGTKQAAELVQGKWIVEVAELAAIRGAALESVKVFITRQTDDYRAPYARHAESRPRRFVVAGTTNSQGFLVDATGNRRFLPIRCGSQEPLLDLFDSGAAGHFEQAWAEAMERFAPSAGTALPDLVLPRYVVGTARELQAASTATDARVGIIGDYLDRFGEGDATCVVQVIEEALGRPREQQTRREQMEVAEILGFSFPGWAQSPGKRRFGPYGPQRAFVKTGKG